ncbi:MULTISPECIES: hypothetical protein [Bacillus]|uniref:Uncharacterized protein n=1 Tax=Bacillus haynesii TaxID=1925021 RepID=A0AA90IUW6_9BACI|nr:MULTISPECIES: hypothetical protein [Bacillus]MCY7791640.1 hypothetical protein [Bacillus haynesii]MCY7800784.1 hypothetical protein [Bacillus haynesii]MCY8023522.1 hypothetical protein [Bacillus licheniformis]MCY9279246.1 hypothetical protein [Bacillus haynesii]
MEFETFSAVATIISAIATVIAAIATAIAARGSRAAADEARKSNEISQKEITKRERPVLDLQTKKFSAKLGYDFFTQWDNGDSNHLINRASDFFVELFNISDTTARNVSVTFDTTHTKEMLANLFPQSIWVNKENNLRIDVIKYSDGLHLDFCIKDGERFRSILITPMMERIGSVYPMKYNNNEPTKIHLPLYFLYLLNFICTDFATYTKKHISLKVTLKYSDSSNKEYVQNILLTPIFTKVTEANGIKRNGDVGFSLNGRLISQELSNEELRMAE